MKHYLINFIWFKKCTFHYFLFSSKLIELFNILVWTAPVSPGTCSNDAGEKIGVRKKKKNLAPDFILYIPKAKKLFVMYVLGSTFASTKS